MVKASRSIFRSSAMQHNMRGRERDVLPHLVSPLVFVFFWIVLGLLLLAGCLALWVRVPIYVAGSGILLQSSSGQHDTTALIFLPADYPFKLRTGLPVRLQIGATSPQYIGQIEKIELGIVSPLDARKRYALGSSVAQVISQPSVVLIARVGSPLSAGIYAGSIVSAQVQTGSQSILSLLPGLGGLSGV